MTLNSDTRISAKIDWLAITNDEFDFPENWDNRKKLMGHGMNGYDIAHQFIDGRILLTSTTRKDMKQHLIMSGGTIDRICKSSNKSSFQISEIAKGCKLSRLDVAIDVKHGSLNIEDFRDAFEAGNVDTKAHKALYMAAVAEAGATLYVGSPKSSKRLRIYDKAAEQQVEFEWTRIELQLRSKYATSGYKLMNAKGKPGRGTADLVNSFVSFPNSSDWFIIFGSETELVPECTIHPPNREKWLMDTATSALANEMLSSLDAANMLDKFIKETMRLYGEKQDKYQ